VRVSSKALRYPPDPPSDGKLPAGVFSRVDTEKGGSAK
jgi:hypothetical protein